MTPINDKIGFRGFLARIFISNSGVSSRRVLAFASFIICTVLAFLHYDFQVVKFFGIMLMVLLGLTTFSSWANPADIEPQNKIGFKNGEKG